jgi:hypothetical protein
MMTSIQTYFGLGDVAPQPGSAPEGHKATLPFKRHLPRLEGTNSCTQFSLRRGHHFGKDHTGQFDASVDPTEARWTGVMSPSLMGQELSPERRI